MARQEMLIERFVDHARRQGGHPALWQREGQDWRPISWSAYLEKVEQFAGALLAMGLEPGEAIAITGDNCPQWVIACVGAMMARVSATGIYQTSTPKGLAYVADHCEARVLVLEDERQWDKVMAAGEALSRVERFVLIRDAAEIDDDRVVSFEDFLASGYPRQGDVEARRQAIEPEDLAILIYTSGTTGPPKGVMLTHGNVSWTAIASIRANGDVTDEDCVVSYLPLSHIAEQMFSIHIALAAGYPVWFCSDINQVKDALVAARPTVFLAVPRVWEKFRAALEDRLHEAQGAKAAIVRWARGVGLRAGYEFLEQGVLSGALAVQYRLADRLFFSKLKAGLGFDRLRVAVSGAAPIGMDVLEFFMSCGIIIHEVYGQSEGCGPTTYNRPVPGGTRLGSVGRPFPGVEIRIAEDGEILVKGPNVFRGYLKDEEATAEALGEGGWLHSGDVGKLGADGFVRITDRKKDLIITSGGKNVAPQTIEKLLRSIDGVSQAIVLGDGRAFLSALLTLDPERAPALAAARGWPTDLERLAEHPALRDYVQAALDGINVGLARFETIKRFKLLAHDFTHETGELTPTQKIKRRAVHERHRDSIENLYAGVR